MIRASRICIWILLALVSCEFVFLSYNWLAYSSPLDAVSFVFSGNWFRSKFLLVNAGTALDQPTVGKFLLWCSALAYLGCTMMVLLRLAAGVERRIARRCITVFAALLAFLLLIEFLAPTFLLVQYVLSMGITPPRLVGLGICGSIFILLPVFFIWIRKEDPFSTPWVKSPITWTWAVTLVTPLYYMFQMLNWSLHSWDMISIFFMLVWVVVIAPLPWIVWAIAQETNLHRDCSP